MRPTSIRFRDGMWRLIRARAEEEGVSAAQYIRESVLIRMAWEDARNSGGDWDAALATIRELLGDDE